MLELVQSWYKRRFSDPNAVSLLAILIIGFVTIYFFGHLIAPLLVAVVLAYLLEWPVMHLQRWHLPRTPAVILVLLVFIGLMLFALFGLVPTVNIFRWTADTSLFPINNNWAFHQFRGFGHRVK